MVLSLFLFPSRPPVSLSFHLVRLRTADTDTASPCHRFISSLRPRILDLSDFQSEPRRQTLRSAPVASHHLAGLVYGLRRLYRRMCCLSCRSTSAVNCRPQLLSLDPSARNKTKLETLQRSRVRHVTCSDPECGDWLRPSSAVIPFLRKMSINCPRRLPHLSTRGQACHPGKVGSSRGIARRWCIWRAVGVGEDGALGRLQTMTGVWRPAKEPSLHSLNWWRIVLPAPTPPGAPVRIPPDASLQGTTQTLPNCMWRNRSRSTHTPPAAPGPRIAAKPSPQYALIQLSPCCDPRPPGRPQSS